PKRIEAKKEERADYADDLPYNLDSSFESLDSLVMMDDIEEEDEEMEGVYYDQTTVDTPTEEDATAAFAAPTEEIPAAPHVEQLPSTDAATERSKPESDSLKEAATAPVDPTKQDLREEESGGEHDDEYGMQWVPKPASANSGNPVVDALMM
ncbi:hypothetical protein PMAYCL1PPCAC_25461, partial [Pristionchus mayeri]